MICLNISLSHTRARTHTRTHTHIHTPYVVNFSDEDKLRQHVLFLQKVVVNGNKVHISHRLFGVQVLVLGEVHGNKPEWHESNTQAAEVHFRFHMSASETETKPARVNISSSTPSLLFQHEKKLTRVSVHLTGFCCC